MPVGHDLSVIADEEARAVEHLRMIFRLRLAGGESLHIAITVDAREKQFLSSRHHDLVIKLIEHQDDAAFLFLKNLIRRLFPA